MGKEIKAMLEDEIGSLFDELSELKQDDKEMSTVIDNITKLYKLKIEESKIENELVEKQKSRESEEKFKLEGRLFEEEFKRDTLELDRKFKCDTLEADKKYKSEQLKEQDKDRYFKLGIDIAGIILPMMFYAAWMRRGFKFEENGTYTSTTFKGLFNRFKPTK